MMSISFLVCVVVAALEFAIECAGIRLSLPRHRGDRGSMVQSASIVEGGDEWLMTYCEWCV